MNINTFYILEYQIGQQWYTIDDIDAEPLRFSTLEELKQDKDNCAHFFPETEFRATKVTVTTIKEFLPL